MRRERDNVTEDLADYVRRILKEKNLTTQMVADRSGNGITQSYVSQIVNRRVDSVSVDKLKALAKGLGVRGLELCAIAIGEDLEDYINPPANEISTFFFEVENLSEEDQKEFQGLINIARKAIAKMKEDHN